MRTIAQIVAEMESLEIEWAQFVGAHDVEACSDCERRYEALVDELWAAGGIGE